MAKLGVPPSAVGASLMFSSHGVSLPLLFPTLSRGRYRIVRSSAYHSHSQHSHEGFLGSYSDNTLQKPQAFSSISSSSSQETTSVGVSPSLSVPPPASVGSPLFWIGIGVGLSALFSWAANNVKKYALQQAFKSMMDHMPSSQDSQISGAHSPGFPLPSPPIMGQPIPSSISVTASEVVATEDTTMDVALPTVEAAPISETSTEMNVDAEVKGAKKCAFVDVAPDVMQKDAMGRSDESQYVRRSLGDACSSGTESSTRGTVSANHTHETGKFNSFLSVEALEKMLEDPTVQKMVYSFLPEEMRNPSTFKWMLQNPQYRGQLQAMLNNMSGSNAWNKQMADALEDFNLSSSEVKQQFEQIGLTPEDVISKIMANPEVALAFQNPKIQAAIMECSQNPLSLTKYQDDREVMDVFRKMSELFPGVTGSL